MTDDATLSDFASSGVDEETDDPETVPKESDATSPSNPASDDGDKADPATDAASLSTYAWGEYTCTRCDRTTDRIWRDDGAVVCPDCKNW
ncbi:DUF7573 domain-containing protein [Halosolutus halophilus]|uniref:DUF7573 domain-containing protein n=1 Tax=Halosolutus halophilus TaxID=1552990 RepID=UPI00223506F6|nr:hypothetical protein [Halosolutus halophilus]